MKLSQPSSPSSLRSLHDKNLNYFSVVQQTQVHASTNNGDNASSKQQPASAKGRQQQQGRGSGNDGSGAKPTISISSFQDIKTLLVAVRMAYEDTKMPLSTEVSKLVADAAAATAKLATGFEPDGQEFGPRQRRSKKGTAASVASTDSGDEAKVASGDDSGSDEGEGLSSEQVTELLELLRLLLPLATPRMGPRYVSWVPMQQAPQPPACMAMPATSMLSRQACQLSLDLQCNAPDLVST
jgi:hypothetical protein